MAEALLQAIVIDNGTGMMKVDFAGGDRPQHIFSAAVGRPKHRRALISGGSALEGSAFVVGSKVQEHRGALRISYPMAHGVVQHWDDMEKLWGYVYSKDCLDVESNEHPVLLSEAPLNPRKNRERAAEVFFEHFKVPAMYCAPQAILSLYASGRTTGLVLDSGDGVTHAVPVYEGFALPHAVERVDVAGREVTQRLQHLLRLSGHRLQTSAELEIVRSMKEETCYVAFDPQKERANPTRAPAEYRLPDGELIELGPERFEAPEVLFRPELIGSEEQGVHQCLYTSLMRSDRDLRSVLYKQIVLAGGSTMYTGYGDRLLRELRKLSPFNTKITISAPPMRIFSTWVGGSILASLAAFNTMWVTREDYNDAGAERLHEGMI